MLEVDVARRLGGFELDAGFVTGPGVTALFGPSGAGKTSVVSMIAGLLRPDRGRIAVDGRVLFDADAGIDLPVRRRRVGYVFQEGRLFPHLTVRGNLRYGCWFSRPRERWAGERRIVELLGIAALLDRRPGDLSGGEKQRVAIGRALLASPEILLMDEPLAALDAPRKAEILPYLERLRDEMRLPIVYVSHTVEEVARLATTVVLMAGGRVVVTGPVAAVLGRPDLSADDPEKAGTLVEAVVEAIDPAYGLARLAIGRQALSLPDPGRPVGTRVRLWVRARDVALAVERPEGLSIRNALAARIVAIAERGPYAEVALDVDGLRLAARITRRAAADLGLAAGMPIHALVKSVAVERAGDAPRPIAPDRPVL